MSNTHNPPTLSYEGALRLIAAAVAHANKMGQPQCIAVVDAGCNLLAFVRMDGAKIQSEHSSITKAKTAASSRSETGSAPAYLDGTLAMATGLRWSNLKGGMPVIVDGHVVGGIGVGSGTSEQDVEVATVALEALR